MNVFLAAAQAKAAQDNPVPWHKNREDRYEIKDGQAVDKIRGVLVDPLVKINQQNKCMVIMMREMQQYLYMSDHICRRLEVLAPSPEHTNIEGFDIDLSNLKSFRERMSSILTEYGEL
jgi:hypothetical protein